MTTDPPPDSATRSRTPLGPWLLRALWLVQPLVCGPTYARALDDRLDSVQIGVSLGLWVVWGLVLGASLVPRTVTLTAIRLAVPAAVASFSWASVASGVDGLSIVGLVVAVLAAVAVFLPDTPGSFVDGSSYGDERRMPLRTPALLLAGPVEVAWLAAVGGISVGPLLLLAQRWLTGAVAVAVGVPVAALAIRALHGLARRWLVFVPAGLVLHDPMAVADPVLFARRSVRVLLPAAADTEALDLTLGALGLALEIRVDQPVTLTIGRLGAIGPGGAKGVGSSERRDDQEASRVLFTPLQPGAVRAEAARRHISTAGR
jgi:hypothetical protein